MWISHFFEKFFKDFLLKKTLPKIENIPSKSDGGGEEKEPLLTSKINSSI